MNMQAKGKSTVRLCNSGSSGLQHDVRDTILTSRFVKVDIFFQHSYFISGHYVRPQTV